MCGNGNLDNFVLILVKNKDLSLSNDQNVVLFMLHFLEKKAHFDHLAFFVWLGQVPSKYISLQALDGLVIN